LDVSAAAAALSSAGLEPDDIDLVLVSSLLPNQIGLGNAAVLARELGISAPARNMESASSGGVVALQNASALIAAGNTTRSWSSFSANLFHAVQSGKIRDHDLVLLLTVGVASTAGAIVILRGEVALSPPPPTSSERVSALLR
jgi:3-oxoacyl-[acyl-carrier-protein] synthase III